MSYEVARLEEIDEIDDGRCLFRPVRHHLGISAFGVNAWTGRETGDRIINEHDEAGSGDSQEELYLVLKGHARFEIDGEDVDAPEGTFLFLRPGPKRTAFAEEAETTVLAFGGVAGKPYEVGGWELWAPLNSLYREGRYEEAADRAKPLAEEHPEYPMLAYNLACCEALAGRKEDAIDHLRPLSGTDVFQSYAVEDSDLDSLRDEPAFQELLRS